MVADMGVTCPTEDETASKIFMTSEGGGKGFYMLRVLITAVSIYEKTKGRELAWVAR